jgi:hypothetical protein
VQANAAWLMTARAAEATARRTFEAARRALDDAAAARRALEHPRAACVDCAVLGELGARACAGVRATHCVLCEEAFCSACFDKFELCVRCDDRERCRDCCVYRHGETGDDSCGDDDWDDLCALHDTA